MINDQQGIKNYIYIYILYIYIIFITWYMVFLQQVHGAPVPKLCYCKVSSEVLRQDSQSSYSFGKIQNVGETELSGEKV